MANLLNTTRFKSPNPAATTFNVTIPATAAGSKLICVAGGGATIQARLGVGGTNFTKRTNSLNSREVVAQDIVDAAGGTTTIQIVLNGPENVDGVIFEFAPGALGNFLVGANQGGTGGNNAINTAGRAIVGEITTTGPAVVFAMFTAGAPTVPPAAERFWGFQPVGKQLANEFIATDPTKSKYWTMIGVSDQASAATIRAQTSRANVGQEHQSVAWAYAALDTTNPTYPPHPNPVAAENSLPGNLRNTWFGAIINANIAGYTDAISYAPGAAVSFKVDSGNVGFNVEIYRHGYYGYITFGARLQATISGTPAVQPAPTIDSYGGTVCNWSTTAAWTIPADATPGIYVYNMRRTDNSSFVAQGIFVVRSPIPALPNNQIMIATSEFTWQAYNVWGATTDAGQGYTGYTGRSLYGKAPTVSIAGRSFAVSFDRPIGTIGANSASYYWDSEGGLVSFLEGNGYDLAYVTSTEIDKDKTIPSKFKVAVISGHSEYWTDNLRDGYENARDAGTNVLVVSANTSLWRVRFDPSDTNRRKMICYKDSHDIAGYDGVTKYDPVSYTGTWRDSRTNPGGVNNTFQRPESGLTGQWFIGNGPFNDRIVVPNMFNSLPIWRNTRVATGGTITFRGGVGTSLTAAGTQITYNQPAGTQVGDLIAILLVFNSAPGAFVENGFRLVRRSIDGTSQYTHLFVGYATTAGAAAGNFTWTNAAVVSVAISVYGGAVWWDTDAAIKLDGNQTKTTRSIANAAANTWAIAAFGDTDTTGSSRTTSWTPGAGLTQRVSANNSASGSGPWNSATIMDTNGVVTEGPHQYSATAQYANPRGAAAIMYISPGVPLMAGTIGYEWDYVKRDEPSTPTNLVMLSQQPISLQSKAANYNGDAYQNNGIYKYGMSLYKADSSDALVFDAGTWRYQHGLSRFRNGTLDTNGSIDVAMQQSIINILKDLGVSYTTLLSTLANNDPTPLVDPGPSATAADYGLTLTPTPYQHIFRSPQVPNSGLSNNLDGTNDYTFGTVFTASVNGAVHGIRWYFPDDLPNDHVIGLLYSWTDNSNGVELARLTFKNTQSGWNQAEFSSPVNIVAGTKYVAAVWTVDRFVTSLGMFSASAITNGDLTAPQDTAGTRNGKLKAGAGSPSYPDSSSNSNGYLADVLFVASTPGPLNFEGWGIPID